MAREMLSVVRFLKESVAGSVILCVSHVADGLSNDFEKDGTV